MQLVFDKRNKENDILKKYISIIESNNYKSNNILMLVDNNLIKLDYIHKIKLKMNEELKISTYSQFVKQELIKYWPIISNKCELITDECISPSFISNNLKNYIFENKIKRKRNKENYFNDITATDKSIASNIIFNLDHALYNDIDYKSIGKKIYNSKKTIENIESLSYIKMDEIIEEYIEEMIKNSILDDSIAVYLYSKYLLTEEVYRKDLDRRYDYIFIDDLQNVSVNQIYLIELFKKYDKEIYLYIDDSRYFSSFIKNDLVYLKNSLLKDEKDYLNKSDITIEDLRNNTCHIELNQNNQLYSEMVDDIVLKIKEIVDSGEDKKNIAIITPINSLVLDYQIQEELKKYNIDVVNTKKDSKMIEYPYGNVLYVAIAIFLDLEDYIKEEEYINFIQILFNLNRIKAYKIYKDKENNLDYQQLLKYIKDKKRDEINIGEFLLKFYIDKVLNLKYGRDNVVLCQNIISESEVFAECLSKLSLNKLKNTEEVFLESLKKFIKDYFLSSQMQDIVEEDKIIITTPYFFISNKINRKTQIWVDIGSNTWSMKIEKDLSNLMILKKSFEDNKIYTADMEDYYRRYFLYNTVNNLLVQATNIYAFKSDYSINGYMQEGSLYNLILRLIDKGDESFE